LKILLLLMLLLFSFAGYTQELSEPYDFEAIDRPSDNGSAIIITWKKMEYEDENTFYVPEISESEAGPFFQLDTLSSLLHFKSDLPNPFGYSRKNNEYHAFVINSFKADDKTVYIEPNKKYFIKLSVEKNGANAGGEKILSVTPVANLFAFHMTNNLVILIFLAIAILTFIKIAKSNSSLFIRRISGLEAIEDALGRATEMGKSVLFAHGLKSVSEVSTIAAINILGRIAKKVAEFDTELKVANWDPIIQQVSQETVKEAYMEAGRPDSFKADNVFLAAAEQFSYAAAVEGLMVREKPAANFYFGYFYAEALLLAETGANTGAIQIAGTDAFTQIPFFITTCDYTLIGEELYAASAYLSREPKLLGSLKGQDVGKLAIIVIVILGTLFSTFGWEGFSHLFWPLQ